jgi:hypothetical protein
MPDAVKSDTENRNQEHYRVEVVHPENLVNRIRKLSQITKLQITKV